MEKKNGVIKEKIISLQQFFPEVVEFSHTRTNSAKPFVPSFEGEGLTSILYIEKGNFAIRYETGEVLTPKGGTFYYHPSLFLHYQTYDKTITPYSMYRLVVDLSSKNLPTFSSELIRQEVVDQLPVKPFMRKAPPLMVASFRTVLEEHQYKRDGYLVQIENSIRQILIAAIRASKKVENVIDGTHWLVEKVDCFLHENMEFMGPVEELFDQLGVSRSRAYETFHQIIGINPKEYILRKKITSAKEMLAQDMDITSIAFKLGFSSSQSFATVFKKLTCTTPREYKKKCKQTF